MHAVKFAEGTDNIIEGIGIPFGGPFAGKDIQGEYFDKDSDLCLDWFEKRPLLYHHGLDEKIKTERIGTVFAHEMTDDGLWVKAQLDKRSKYYALVKQLVDKEALGFSSGAVSHLVQTTKDGKIKRWPYIEQSLTPTEANPDAFVAYGVKAAEALDHMEAAHISIPEPLEAALKAVDEWANEQPTGDPEPESLADHSQRVLAEVKAWVERVSERSDFRAKAGRELSRANVEALRTAYRLIGELLERNDKPEADEAEAAKAVAEFERLQAVLLGAIPE